MPEQRIMKPSNYSLTGYGDMIVDTPRMSAYDAALHQAIKPGMVVLDIGAGTGILSLLACKYGARHVYAIEPDESINVARQSAAANGMADGITFIQDISTRITLPERADVLVSDLRGSLPLFEQHIPSIVDARARLLKPNAIQIPLRDILSAAPVESEKKYREYAEPWTSGYAGLDLSTAREVALNTRGKITLLPEALLAPALTWATLEYTQITDPNVKGELRWRAERSGTLHGVAVWFTAELAEGIGFSNAPGAPNMPQLLYERAFFPLLHPVAIEPGDSIRITLQAKLSLPNYLFRWDTTVYDQSNPPKVKAQFKQSTFNSMPLSMDALRKTAPDYAPALNAVDRAFAALADGNATLRDIAEQLRQRFPQRFATHKDALTYAGEMAQKFSAD